MTEISLYRRIFKSDNFVLFVLSRIKQNAVNVLYSKYRISGVTVAARPIFTSVNKADVM